MENRIRYFRQKANDTQENVSKGTGISFSQISWYENDRVTPNIKTCIKFADYFDVTLDELFRTKKSKKHSAPKSKTKIVTKYIDELVSVSEQIGHVANQIEYFNQGKFVGVRIDDLSDYKNGLLDSQKEIKESIINELLTSRENKPRNQTTNNKG